MTADQIWLDLRVPYDDAARQHSFEFVDQAATALQERAASATQPVVILDVGAGTGNSAQWFKQHLTPRLPGRDLRWVLLDADAAALRTASDTMPEAEMVTAPISQLPCIADELLSKSQEPAQLLITGSAVLDVLTQSDVHAITDTIIRHTGIGLLLLSITGAWQLTPADPQDAIINRAFCAHQQRGGKLGPGAPAVLLAEAQRAGASVESGNSPWRLVAPRDQEFMARFLTERIEAVVAQQPQLRSVATDWLDRRRAQLTAGLSMEIEHLDVYLDGR